MGVVDVAVYREGRRVGAAVEVRAALAEANQNGGFVWAGYLHPTEDELAELAEVFSLHPLAVEDVWQGHQRPKIERYDDVTFMVLRPARYIDESELVEFGELHLFIGPNFVISIRLAENPKLGSVRRELETASDLLAIGPYAAMHAIVDRVVDDYIPVVAGLENDLDEIENELFDTSGTTQELARRIYLLSREVNEFQRATVPLLDTLRSQRLATSATALDIEVQRGMRDVVDHLIPICDRIEIFHSTLRDALAVHLSLVTKQREEQMAQMTQVAIDQSDAMKKISSWAAIIFAPTLISGIYGMNFRAMPELTWLAGYPIAIAAMGGFALTLYIIFKRKDWL